jgi:hypothetical protein
MDRRNFFAFAAGAFATGVLSMLSGCGKKEDMPRLGNQEKLWRMSTGPEKLNEPVDLAYAKNTPAIYRDASFGKEDPNFKPKTGGG